MRVSDVKLNCTYVILQYVLIRNAEGVFEFLCDILICSNSSSLCHACCIPSVSLHATSIQVSPSRDSLTVWLSVAVCYRHATGNNLFEFILPAAVLLTFFGYHFDFHKEK